jgi:hypothetical protein
LRAKEWILDPGTVSHEYVIGTAINQFGNGISHAADESARESLFQLGCERVVRAVPGRNTLNVQPCVLRPGTQSLGHVSLKAGVRRGDSGCLSLGRIDVSQQKSRPILG